MNNMDALPPSLELPFQKCHSPDSVVAGFSFNIPLPLRRNDNSFDRASEFLSSWIEGAEHGDVGVLPALSRRNIYSSNDNPTERFNRRNTIDHVFSHRNEARGNGVSSARGRRSSVGACHGRHSLERRVSTADGSISGERDSSRMNGGSSLSERDVFARRQSNSTEQSDVLCGESPVSLPQHPNTTALPKYDLGDEGCVEDMVVEMNPVKALQDLDSLQVHDFAFVLRSDGRWTYAIIANRPYERGLNASIRFVMDKNGSTKTVHLSQWATFIRLVNAPSRRR